MSEGEVVNTHIYAKVVAVIEEFLGKIPTTVEPISTDPKKRAAEITTAACIKAAAVSGTLALPPGPLGMLTVIPDLMMVWKIQAQMVVDIAGCYGKVAFLSKESMLYCLFRHAASQAVRDLVIRVGERVLIQRGTLRVIQKVMQMVGVKVTQRLVGKSITRLLGPLAALGVAGYAYYDTAQVSKTTIEFFSSNLGQEEGGDQGLQPSDM